MLGLEETVYHLLLDVSMPSWVPAGLKSPAIILLVLRSLPFASQVVPVAARLLLEMFSGELSWSADSIRLQISNPDLKDHMVEQFKELHHIWQSQQRVQPMVQAPPVAGLDAGQGSWPMHPVGMQ